MKTRFFLIMTFIVSLLLLSGQAKSALSGSYTIDNTLPTAGRNFNSFKEAIDTLNSQGISGAVTFEVIAGQVHNISLTDSKGLWIKSSGYPDKIITFHKSGSGANPKLKVKGTSGSDACFYLDNVNYITIDGLDIECAGTSNNNDYLEQGFYLINSSNIQLINCNILLQNTSYYNRYGINSTGIVSMLLTENVNVKNASYGYYFNSSGTGNTISKNTIDNVGTGCYNKNQQTNFTIKDTKITNANTGINLNTGNNQRVYNNVIQATYSGISLSTGSTDTVHLAYNTIYIPATASASYCLNQSYNGRLGLYNNIFINKSTNSYSACFTDYTDSKTLIEGSNNNIYYCEGGAIYKNSTITKYNIKEYINLLGDGRESNSCQTDVPFISTVAPFDFHIRTDVPTKAESGGQPLSWVSSDIDGNARNSSTPDIGAYEFNGIKDNTVLTPMSGVYTINITQPTAGRNFNSFGDAINELNNAGISTTVTFNVMAGQIHNITLKDSKGFRIISGGTADKPVIFQKSGTGANPLLKITGTTNTADVCFNLGNVNYITFDGIDIENAGTSNSNNLEQAFYLDNSSNIQLLNCTIRNTGNGYGIWANGTVNALHTENIIIKNTVYGYYFNGSGTDNIISRNVIDSVSTGINVANTQNNFTVKESKIINASNAGISLNSGTNQRIYNNIIFSTSNGIHLENSNDQDTIHIAHNTVYIPAATNSYYSACLDLSGTSQWAPYFAGKLSVSNNIFINKSTNANSFNLPYCISNNTAVALIININ